MRVVTISTSVAAIALSAFALTSYAENTDASHNWMPKQPGNAYWQTPNWSGFNMPPAYNPAQRPPTNYNNYRRPAPQAYRPPAPPANNSAPNVNRATPPPVNNTYRGNMPPPPRANNAYRGNMPPPPRANNAYRGNMPPPPRGPYRSPYYSDNGASAYNIPGYNRNRNNNGWGNGWNNNNFWGNSGPGKWMNPNKNNMEQGWDDMINAPSRMGEMPGGWNAPEISMPNPIDMGDQFQDNIKDLPEQIRNMDVGN